MSDAALDFLSEDESETPPMEEVYNSKIIKPKVNNNKYILTTDSDSDLPDLDFTDINKNKQQQPCSSLPSSDLYIRSLVQPEDVTMVTEDFHTTGDVTLSINRYFDGTIFSIKTEHEIDQSKYDTDSDSPTFVDNHHDNAKLFIETNFSNEVSKFGTKTKSGVSKKLILEVQTSEDVDESVQDFTLEFSPFSSNNVTPVSKQKFEFDETTQTPAQQQQAQQQQTQQQQTQQQQTQQQQTQQQTQKQKQTQTDKRRKQDLILSKQKQIDRLNRKSHRQLNYKITTTKYFDKHLLAQLKSGIKISNTNNFIFEQSTNDSDFQFVYWECQRTVYELSELNEVQEQKSRINCDFVCVVLSMIEFAERYQINNEFLEKIIETFSNTKKSVLIYGVGEYFSNVEAGDLPRSTFDVLQTYYQIKMHLTIHISNTILQASDMLVRLMRGVKGHASKREKIFSFNIHSPKKGRGIKNQDDQSRVWKNQLLQLSRVSEQIASVIVDRYPTPGVLYSAYNKCKTVEEKRDLLKSILVNKRKIGTPTSEKIYLLFHCNNSELKI